MTTGERKAFIDAVAPLRVITALPFHRGFSTGCSDSWSLFLAASSGAEAVYCSAGVFDHFSVLSSAKP